MASKRPTWFPKDENGLFQMVSKRQQLLPNIQTGSKMPKCQSGSTCLSWAFWSQISKQKRNLCFRKQLWPLQDNLLPPAIQRKGDLQRTKYVFHLPSQSTEKMSVLPAIPITGTYVFHRPSQLREKCVFDRPSKLKEQWIQWQKAKAKPHSFSGHPFNHGLREEGMAGG